MPVLIDYESFGPTILYETDADGALHIAIPARGWRLAGSQSNKGGVALVVFLAICGIIPLAISVVIWWSTRDFDHFIFLVVACCVTPITFLIVGWALAYSAGVKTWIDVTPTGFSIRREFGGKTDQRTFLRERLRALGVVKDSEGTAWHLRVHGRYEWEILPLHHLPKSDLDAMAVRLREILKLPERPAGSEE